VAFSFLLNRLLASEAWARQRLAPFAGETVELRAPPLPALRLRILEGGTVDAGGAEAGLTMTLKP
jgi:ubiquinone biosynthesis protein UbiJ